MESLKRKMLQLDLKRLTLDQNLPQVGVLYWKAQPAFVTLELPYMANVSSVSCIPAGHYFCKKVFNRTTNGGSHIPVTFEVENVLDRSGILFHVGNNLGDTQGCILIGLKLGTNSPDGNLILDSKEGFQKFLALTKDVSRFEIFIR